MNGVWNNDQKLILLLWKQNSFCCVRVLKVTKGSFWMIDIIAVLITTFISCIFIVSMYTWGVASYFAIFQLYADKQLWCVHVLCQEAMRVYGASWCLEHQIWHPPSVLLTPDNQSCSPALTSVLSAKQGEAISFGMHDPTWFWSQVSN